MRRSLVKWVVLQSMRRAEIDIPRNSLIVEALVEQLVDLSPFDSIGDGTIIELLKWLAEFIVENADTILAIIEALIVIFSEDDE